MTDQQTEFTPEQLEATKKEIMANARSLASAFEKSSNGKKWFKPIHIKREVRGETESTIKGKLDILVELQFAVRKQEENGDSKYMIVISEKQRLNYLNELLEHYGLQVIDTQKKILELQKDI